MTSPTRPSSMSRSSSAQVEAAVLARPDEAWRLTVRAAERRRILACVPMPALGWSAIEVVAGGGAGRDEPGTRGRMP